MKTDSPALRLKSARIDLASRLKSMFAKAGNAISKKRIPSRKVVDLFLFIDYPVCFFRGRLLI
jgi:hypothetical protein